MSGGRGRDEGPSAKLRRIEHGVEQRLADLAAAGELSGLPGEGKPFADRGPDQAGERWAAFRLMSGNRVLPAWAQLRREIEDEIVRLERAGMAHRAWAGRRRTQLAALPAERILEAARATAAREEGVRADVEAAVAALNLKVAQFNARVPVDSLQLTPFRTERFLAER